MGEEQGQRVVVVDDDGVSLAMLARGLRKRGYEVAAYSDPREMLSRLREDRPVAVITDMRMPHLSGLDVVERVHTTLGATAPAVLVVSADGDETLLNEAFRLGAVDYLLKPVSDAELGAKLEKALRNKPRHAGPSVIPEQVGAWTLGECIGRGGTACVFRATREGATIPFALKVVWPHLTSNTETLLRFRREIDALSALEHPQLVRFVESGREEEAYYYVMEYLAGGTLRDRLRAKGAGTPLEVLEMLEQLADPLSYLHSEGLVHRDLKPSNIFVDKRGFVLGDFGLTRRLLDHGITLAEEFIGTPLYLAPEVFRSREFDHSVDYYALGVCAMEFLHGEPILRELDSMALIGRLMDQGLPSPRTALGPCAPEPLVALIADLVHSDASLRLKTKDELLARVREARAALAS
ncbi:MAG: protein kinase [Planctomycetes bacterium]|nr:protein kinase [Planctomycetota bacterium]